MAKIRINPDISLADAAKQLALSGITLDTHRLPDGSFRAYVRKSNLDIFNQFINQFNNLTA